MKQENAKILFYTASLQEALGSAHDGVIDLDLDRQIVN